MERYEHLLGDIYRTEDLINFVPMLFIACTVDKNQNTDRLIEPFELLFQRYSLRMLYHAKNFINKVLTILKDNESKIQHNNSIGFQIGPEVYFEFDAFLYSCKSIFEKNIKDKGSQYFSKDRKNAFSQIAQEAYQKFVPKTLSSLRNEAVHLNYFGTSISQMILITDREGEKTVKLHSTFINDNGQELNLMDLFINLLQLSNDVVQKIITLVIEEIISKFGAPNNLTTQYNVGKSVFKIEDFLK